MNKAQQVTRYIKHLADSTDLKGGTFNNHRNGLIGNHFEKPNVSYTRTLAFIVGSDSAFNKRNQTLSYENY